MLSIPENEAIMRRFRYFIFLQFFKSIYLDVKFSEHSCVSLLLQTMIIVKYNMYLSLWWTPNRMTRTI